MISARFRGEHTDAKTDGISRRTVDPHDDGVFFGLVPRLEEHEVDLLAVPHVQVSRVGFGGRVAPSLVVGLDPDFVVLSRRYQRPHVTLMPVPPQRQLRRHCSSAARYVVLTGCRCEVIVTCSSPWILASVMSFA